MSARRTYRAVDYLPADLHADVRAIARRRDRTLSQIWDWACHQAAADVLQGLDGKASHPLPPPVEWSSIPKRARVKVAWTTSEAVEQRHLKLIALGGSTRTAILICAAESYAAVDGELELLLMDREPGSAWGVLPGG